MKEVFLMFKPIFVETVFSAYIKIINVDHFIVVGAISFE